jgi:hypothetical protein
MKTNYRSRLMIEKALRIAILSVTPQFVKLLAKKQSYPSQ